MKNFIRILAIALALTGLVACDSPSEQATEEKIEDKGEAAGMSEDAAEKQGEAATDGGVTDTTGTTGTTTTQTETSTTTVSTTTT